MKLTFRLKGGKGSGFHGHAGRPGKVGGSRAEEQENIPDLPKELRTGSSGKVSKRQRERADIMESVYGVKFSTSTTNPLGVEEGKAKGVPGIGLPKAIYDTKVKPIGDKNKINIIKDVYNKYKSPAGFITYTTLKFGSGLSFQEVFGVIKYLRNSNPYNVSMTVDRLNNNTAVKIIDI